MVIATWHNLQQCTCAGQLIKLSAAFRRCLYPWCRHCWAYLGKIVIYCWKDRRKKTLKDHPRITRNPGSPQSTGILDYPHISHFTEIFIIVIVYGDILLTMSRCRSTASDIFKLLVIKLKCRPHMICINQYTAF